MTILAAAIAIIIAVALVGVILYRKNSRCQSQPKLNFPLFLKNIGFRMRLRRLRALKHLW